VIADRGQNMDSVPAWLQKLGLERYIQVFAENDIDLDAVRLIGESDLEKLGVSLGHRKKLLKAIAELNGAVAPAPQSVAPTANRGSDADAAPAAVSTEAGERRQLTALFCDMVGFTELANRVDPEVLQRIIRSYEDACAVCITRYEGHVFQRLGDGIVAFFGYPLAHEDEAERAIRAGLEIIESLSTLEVRDVGHLAVRIGIATGLVVVSTAEKGAVGETMNLASRLQGIAQSGSIVVSERVHRLAGGSFDYEDLGEQTLKGIARPVRAWRVAGVRHVGSRFQAAHVGSLTPLVGREAECNVLRDRWRKVVAGHGQVVDIGGEAGIGKSRLARVIIEETRHDTAVWVTELQCSHFHIQSSLYPVAEQLRQRIFGDERQLDDAARWAAVETYLRTTSLNVEDALPLFAHLLSVPPPADRPPSPLTPERARLLTRQFLVSLIIERAKASPGIFILEDLHWADPSTLDFLDFFMERVRQAAIFVLLTHRPEFDHQLRPQPHVTSLALSRLRGADASELVRLAFREQDFAPDVLRQVVEKTDGVPLYIEEFTKAVVEARQAAITAAKSHVVIPASLHDSLLARLDLLGEAKGVAQLASMLGREFSRDVLTAVWPGSADSLATGLVRLTQAEFIYPASDGSRERYRFKHALIQDAAYESLLKSSLATHHRRIAEVLEARFADVVAEQPEVIAHHYAAGKAPERAAQLWLSAGRRSLSHNAHVEAAAHLRSALGALADLPDTPQRALAELDVQITLGAALVAGKGYASADVEPAWTRAQQLCAIVGDVPQQFPALFGLWMFECVRANHPAARELAAEIFRRGGAIQSDDVLIEARLAIGISHFFLGELAQAQVQFEQIGAMYDPQRHGGHRFQFGQDPAVVALNFLSLVQWLRGEGKRALDTSIRAVATARSLEHPFTLSYALAYAGWHRHFCRDQESADAILEEEIRLCMDEEIPVFLALGQLLAAWSKCEKDNATGRVAMEAALDGFRATGSRCFATYWDVYHAGTLAELGEHTLAEERLNSASAAIEMTHERWAEPELHRMRGIVLERRGKHGAAPEACYRRALACARERGAKAWELRAATSLATCLRAQGRTAEARRELASVLSDFGEPSEGRDFTDALRQLQSLPA
jgi:predicted ATPase/class 3 adenylate cyclase